MSQGIPPTFSSNAPVAAHNTASEYSKEQANAKFADLVSEIQAGHPTTSERFHQLFGRGLQFLLSRALGAWHPELLVNIESDVIAVVRETPGFAPDRLLGLVHATFRGHLTDPIALSLKSNHQGGSPGTTMNMVSPPHLQEMAERAVELLRDLSAQEREVLDRYYLQEQTPEEIRSAMHLDEIQFLSLMGTARRYFKALGSKRTPLVLQFVAVAGSD
jgi:hypothetical protein